MMRFESVHLDLDAREVTLDGIPQHLEPQAFDLLRYLVEHRDRVVPKEELLDNVWGDQFVSESALTTRIKEVRQATGDDGRKQAIIKNVRGRGYRFVAMSGDSGATAGGHFAGDRERQHVPPEPATPSVGIEGIVERLVEMTASRRLVTIVGPGGVGKTRLSQEVGRAVAHRHALGSRIVELARISEPSAVGPAIRRALGRSEVDSGLTAGLGASDALVILDNCEHLVEAVASEIPEALAGGSELCVLATSREPLGVPGEQRVVLDPLATVGRDAPAAALFIDRALDVGVVVTPDDPHVQSIVSALDGIPLALEMAAARLATMGLPEVADELTDSVASLASGFRGVPERHRTLRAVLGWSEALLSEAEREVLADFSVFSGPIQAADLGATVGTNDPPRAIRALAERSLVTVDRTASGMVRYGSLDTVREFGRERLEEDGRLDEVQRRHAEWFVAAAEAAWADYDSVDQVDGVARIDALFDEFRSAHLWARTGDPGLAMRLSFALFQPTYQGLRLEAVRWSLALAEDTPPDVDGAAQLYAEVSLGLTFLGRLVEGRRWAERAIEVASDQFDARAAHGALADICLYDGLLEQSRRHAERQDELVRGRGSLLEQVVTKASLSLPLTYGGRHQAALDVIPAEPPDGSPPLAWAWLAYSRGEALLDADPEAALAELDRAIELAEAVDGGFLSGVAHVSASTLRARTGRPEDAIEPLADAIEMLADRGNATHLLTTLRNLPSLLVRIGEWRAAAELLGGLSAITISPSFGEEAERLGAAEAATRDVLTDEFAAVYTRGSERSLDQTARAAISTLRQM